MFVFEATKAWIVQFYILSYTINTTTFTGAAWKDDPGFIPFLSKHGQGCCKGGRGKVSML